MTRRLMLFFSELFWQVKEAVLFVLAAGCTTTNCVAAETTGKLWVQTTGAADFDSQQTPDYFLAEVNIIQLFCSPA